MKSDLFFLYTSIGLLYVINSGVGILGKSFIDDWLQSHHEFVYLLVATVYFIVAIIYLSKDYKKEKEKIKNKNKNNNKKCQEELKKNKNVSLVIKIYKFIIISFLVYCWTTMIYKLLFTKRTYKPLMIRE